jgi:hypothetical protein
VFVISIVLIYISFILLNIIKSKLILSIIFALFIFVIILIFKIPLKKFESAKGMVRYTMLCHNCGWEWMSNVAKQGMAPKQCPNCRERTRLEILGWRKIKPIQKADKDLRNFLRK